MAVKKLVELIGNTPMVEITRAGGIGKGKNGEAKIFAKFTSATGTGLVVAFSGR